jgi:hypothetical protein
MRPDFTLNSDWALHCVERMWSFGYQSSQLEHLFNAIPPEISLFMKRSLISLQTISRLQPFKMKGPTLPKPTTSLIEEFEQMRTEAEHWDGDEVHGFLQVSYNPHTNARTHVVMNSRYAHLHGYHKEEMLSRFASRDLDVQRTEIDWLILWLENFQVLVRSHSLCHALVPLVACLSPASPLPDPRPR